MGKRKTKEQVAKATLAEVTKEMAEPRVAMSAREHSHIIRNAPLVVKNNIKKRAVNLEPGLVIVNEA
jgi:hypothetical protein